MCDPMDEYREVAKICPEFRTTDPEIIDFYEKLKQGMLVESVDLEKLQRPNTISFWLSAKRVVGMVSPTLALAREIKKVIGDRTVLEVAAGTGLLAKYLNAVGIDIIATDNMSWHQKKYFIWKLYFDVEKLDFKDAIKKYKTDILLLCWPLYDRPLAREAAELFTKLNPEGEILFIGEGQGGCTGDDEFFENVEEIRPLNEVNAVYPRWCGLYDRVFLLKWKHLKT